MSIKKTLSTIIALSFLGTAGCNLSNKMLYEGKFPGELSGVNIKYEQVNSPLEYYSGGHDYKLTLTINDNKWIIIDNNMDSRINPEGDDRVITIFNGEKKEFDKTTAAGVQMLHEADEMYTGVLNYIKLLEKEGTK